MCVCVSVCNPIPQTEATNRGKCSCLTSSMHHFLPPFCRGFVGSSYMSPFGSPDLFLLPQPSFHLLTCLHASVCPSVYHSVTVSNKLVCSPESLSSRSALITVSVSVIFSVCHSDRWSVCFFCVCVCDISGDTLLIFGRWL